MGGQIIARTFSSLTVAGGYGTVLFGRPDSVDELYVYSPATTSGGSGILTLTVTITTKSGTLTGGPTGSTGNGTKSVTFSQAEPYGGSLAVSVLSGLTLAEAAGASADQLAITVSDGVDPAVTERIAVAVAAVPTLSLPATIRATVGEVTPLTGLLPSGLTNTPATAVQLSVTAGEVVAPAYGIDITPGHPYVGNGSIDLGALLADLSYSSTAAGTATLAITATDLHTGQQTSGTVAIVSSGFAAGTPLRVTTPTVIALSQALGGEDANGNALTVDGGGVLELLDGITVSSPYGLAVGQTGAGMVQTRDLGANGPAAAQLAFGSATIGAAAGSSGSVDIGLGTLGVGTLGTIGLGGTGLVFGEETSSLGFGYDGTPQSGAIPLSLPLAPAAFGVGNGSQVATSLVIGAQSGGVGVLDTDGMLGVIGNAVVGQGGGQGALMLEGPAAITGTLSVGAGSFVRADQGFLPGPINLAAGSIFLAEGNSVSALGIGSPYPQPTTLDTAISGSGTLAIVPGASVVLGAGASVGAGVTIAFLPGVDTAGLATGGSPAFDQAGDTGGRLMIRNGANLAGVIAGFRPGEVIQFVDDAVTGVTTAADATPGVTDLVVGLTAGSNGANYQATLRLLSPVASAYAIVAEKLPNVYNEIAADGIAAVGTPAGFTGTPSAALSTPSALRAVAGTPTRLLNVSSVDTGYRYGNYSISLAVQTGVLVDRVSGKSATPGSPLTLAATGASAATDLADLYYTPAAGQTADAITVTSVSTGGTFTNVIPVTVSAAAQTFTWGGGVGGDYAAPASWTVGGAATTQAPTAGDSIAFGPGLSLVTTSGDAGSLSVTGEVEFEQDLTLNSTAASLTVSGGLAVFAPNSTLAASGSLLVTSGTLEVDTEGAQAGAVTIGSGGSGLLRVGPYALLNVGAVTLGATVGSDGRAEVDGQIAVSGNLVVGEAGTAEAALSSFDNDIVTGGITIGDQAGSTGALTLDAAAATVHQGVTVGNAGAGALTVKASGLALAGALVIAGQRGSTGTTVLDGGTVTLSSSYSFIGQSDPSVYVGGTANGAGGSGTLAVGVDDGQGGTLTAPGGVTVWGTGSLGLGSGQLITPKLVVAAGGLVSGYGQVYATSVTSSPRYDLSDAPLTTIQNAGTITAVNDGSVAAQGGELVLYANVSGAGALDLGTGATLEIQGAAAGGTIGFLGRNASLVLDQPSGVTDTVSGFGVTDRIDLPDITYVSGEEATLTGTSLAVTAGGVTAATLTVGTPPGGAHYIVSADGGGGSQITLSTAPGDFNGDGKSDLLLQNNNGAIVAYGLNGLAVNATAFVNDPGPTWHVVGQGDYNGDGQTDILLQNDNGAIVDYTMNGTTVIGAYSLSTPGSGWHVRGAADFNSDGKADFLLQNDNGAMVLFDTNGTSVTAGYALGQLPAGWAIEGVGDFNGDGVPDVLVESNTGTLVDFTVNSTGTGFTSGGTIANVGPGWTVAGTADYNGDGKADILLHNDNGADVVFYMNGSTVTATSVFGNPGPSYQTTLTGIDVNGDGTPDVVVQGTSSTLVGYTLGNNAAITAAAVLNTPGAGWNLVGGNPTTFIDGTGANLALTGTPGPDQFNLTSYGAGVHTIASFDPAQDAVALSVAAFPNYATVQANEAAYQGGTFINLSPSSAIVIQGVTPSQLTAANFVLR